MPDYRRVECKRSQGGCGKNAAEVGPISWRGLCFACGKRRANEMYDALQAHRGPGFDHWRRQVALSVGGALLDDTRPSP